MTTELAGTLYDEDGVKIEDFTMPEIIAEHPEVNAEAVKIIEQLELEGQKSLIGEHGVRTPFRYATAEEKWVLKTLCPQTTKLADYKRTPVPYRVLELARVAMETGLYDKLCVWDVEGAADPDPVLVAHAHGEYESKPVLIARWGSELESWPTLLKRATDRTRRAVHARLIKLKGALSSAIEMCKDDTLSDEILSNVVKEPGALPYFAWSTWSERTGL